MNLVSKFQLEMLESDKPLVSVLMPTYNGEKYIGVAINSLLKSTYSNFELIVVDDCSTDNTFAILETLINDDERIKVFRNERNLGDYPNRNKAASLAVGKYLKYLDHDDYIYPWGLEIMVKNMEEFPNAGIGLFSLPQNSDNPFPIELTPRESYLYNFFGPGLFHKAPLSAIIRRTCFESCGGFMNIRYVGDFEFWLRAAQRYHFLLIHDSLVWYREHENQESRTMGEFESLIYSRIEKKYINDLNSPLNLIQRKSLVKKRIKMYIQLAIISLVKFKVSNAFLSCQKVLIYLGWKK
jgi:glycosyltransferase involved in cell wall biosynthesis